VVVDGVLGDVQAGGDLGVAQVGGEQREHLELSGGEPGGVGRGRPPRTARQPPHAELAQPPGNGVGGRPCPQPRQLVQRPPQRLLLVGLGQREGGLVRAAQLAPALGRPGPLAGELERVRLGNIGRDLTAEASAAAPAGQLTGQ
jgi:hypothetical protein